MSNNDQQLVDHLYQQIVVQKQRCDHFDTMKPKPSSESVWNKSRDETIILYIAVSKYKKYYQDKAAELKNKLFIKCIVLKRSLKMGKRRKRLNRIGLYLPFEKFIKKDICKKNV